MKDLLLVYSGGMDSTVLLYKFKDSIKMAINFQYGSKHNKRELEYAIQNCDNLDIPLLTQRLDFSLFESDLLLSGGDIPKGHYEDSNMKKTVVPFRNGIMLSYAAGIAESNNLTGLLIANHSGDHAIYPDCRTDFISAMGDSISRGTDAAVKLYAPFSDISKRTIALIGKEVQVNFNNTYSCYNGGNIHCGECGTCVERKEALYGFDTTEYLV